MDFNQYQLPKHIAYTRALPLPLRFNLSNSCAQSLTVGQLANMAIQPIDELMLSYSAVSGSLPLREAIGDYIKRYSAKVDELNAEHILTFCGAQEALAAIYHTVLSPGYEIVVCSPCYPSLIAMAQKVGCQVKEIKLDVENNWQLNINSVKRQFSSKTKLLVLNSPHNPTGTIISPSLARELLELARLHDCYLLTDDVAQASNYNDLDLKHDFLSYEKAVSVGVMSKSLGLAGLRIGWLATKNPLWMDALLAYKSTSSICTSAVDESLATTALANCERIIEHNNEQIQQNIHHFEQFVKRHSQYFSWVPPQAGILAIVEYKGEEGVEQLSQQLASQYQTLLLPSALFGLSGDYFRLGLGQSDFTESLARLDLYISTRV
ncbi:aminotransferase class I/II-fold pyridoxal phosphate-dependent enzyme [Thalassotalea ganghwensis]